MMTDAEIMRLLQAGNRSTWNRARAIFHARSAKISTRYRGGLLNNPMDRRRMEFEAVKEIAEVFGVQISD